MNWFQKEIRISRKSRGFHLITHDLLDNFTEINKINKGILHIFIKHTSASLTINENADPSVRVDFEQIFNRLVREDESYYTHIFEGSDDMPAHVKSTLTGSSVSIPITNGRLNLGTWQGVYLCEFRNRGGSRKLVVTINS